MDAGVGVWSGNGPPGGEIYALAVDPGSAMRVYAGSARGLYASTDAGDTWSVRGTGISGREVVAVAVAPGNSDVLFASALYNGVHRSTDRGLNWAATPLNPYWTYDSLAVDARNANWVYAGGIGVHMSSDGGTGWWSDLEGKRIIAIVVDPTRTRVAYAAGPQVYKTTDGANWAWASTGLAGTPYSLAIDPVKPAVLYAAVGAEGVYKTTDAGSHWFAAKNGLPPGDTATVQWVTLAGGDPGVLYAASDDGRVFRSSDGAGTWQLAGIVPQGAEAEWYKSFIAAPQPGGRLYAALQYRSGPYVSTDGGAGWTLSNRGINNSQPSGLALDPTDPRVAYTTVWNDDYDVWKTTDAGASWTKGAGLKFMPLVYAIDPLAPQVIYTNPLYLKGAQRSTDGGASWQSAGLEDSTINDLAFRPGSETLYAVTDCGLYRTEAAAVDWRWVGAPLPTAPGGDCAGFQGLAVDPLHPDTLYGWGGAAGGANTGFYRSTDGGATWTPLSSWTLTNPRGAIDFAHPGVVYQAIQYKVERSTDYGATWATGTQPGYSEVTGLVIHPDRPATLYTGMNGNGVARSTDSGQTWTQISNTGLADRRVQALAIHPEYPYPLYVYTWHGGVFEYRGAEFNTPTPSPTASPAATETATATIAPSATVTLTPAATASPTATNTMTPVVEPTPTATPSNACLTPQPSATPTATPRPRLWLPVVLR